MHLKHIKAAKFKGTLAIAVTINILKGILNSDSELEPQKLYAMNSRPIVSSYRNSCIEQV